MLSVPEIIEKIKKGHLGSYRPVSLTPVPKKVTEQVTIGVMLCSDTRRMRGAWEHPALVCEGDLCLANATAFPTGGIPLSWVMATSAIWLNASTAVKADPTRSPQ